MAEALIKYETIDSGQIDDLMEGKIPRLPQNWDDNDDSSSSAKKKTKSKITKKDDAPSSDPPAKPA